MCPSSGSRGWPVGEQKRRLGPYCAMGAVFLLARALGAQGVPTWPGGRAGPSLVEIVAIDRTGEPGWPYGEEDVAADGLDRFTAAEQAIDVRSAYAATGSDSFWFRLYVASPNAPTSAVTAFVFIDRDRDIITGGSAVAPEIDPRLTSDASGGGYDSVVAVRGDGTVVDLWRWQGPHYESYGLSSGARARAEAGVYDDPLLLRDRSHGYLQGTVDLEVVELGAVCEARLLFRTVSDAPGLGNGDLDVGAAGPCVAPVNPYDVPVLVLPPGGCQSNADCPGGGYCIDGRCVLAPPCRTDADCPSGEVCSDDGWCVLGPGPECTEDSDCVSRVCLDRQCVPCFTAGAPCPPGLECAPDGRCVDPELAGSGGARPGGAGSGAATGTGGMRPGAGGVYAGSAGLFLAPGEEVQGGACTCSVGNRLRPLLGAWLALLAALGLVGRTKKLNRGGRAS
jgi:Cys-rich repeat protein